MGSPPSASILAVDGVLRRLFGNAPQDVTRAARERAHAFTAIASGPSGAACAALIYAGELVAAHVLERETVGDEIRELVAETAGIAQLEAGFAEAAIFSAALRSRTVLELPPRVASEVAIKLLNAFAGVRETSLWVQRDGGAVTCAVVVGADTPSRRVRRLASEALANVEVVTPGVLQAIPVMQWDRPQGVLVIRTRSDDRERALAHAREVALALVPILEKETLLDRNEARAGALTGATERRLVRLGFDLHDGPLQDIAALAVDLRLFKRQLSGAAVDGAAEILAGRVDDLVARVIATESGLRELAKSFESPTVVRAPLRELLAQQVERLRSDGRLEVEFAFRGRAGEFTASQRIALVRFVEEAFTNIREHSGASRVTLTVTIGRANLRVVVEDDGQGFDVERTLVQAARAGHLGLVGMGERMRLLGGRLDVESALGGPTTVTATIPRWEPPASK